MRVLLADDHPVVQMGLSFLLKDLFPSIEIIKVFDADTMQQRLNEFAVDLLIMDVNMPGDISFEAFEMIRKSHPDLKVMVFSQNQAQIFANRYRHLGAKAYIEKGCSDAVIKQAITEVCLGNYFFLDEETTLIAKLSHENPFHALSNRELEVAGFLIRGDDYQAISEKMAISTSTVSTYKLRLFEKLNVKNQTEFQDLARHYKFI